MIARKHFVTTTLFNYLFPPFFIAFLQFQRWPQLFIEFKPDLTEYVDDMSESEGDDIVDYEFDEPEHEEMGVPTGKEVDKLQSGGLEVEDEPEEDDDGEPDRKEEVSYLSNSPPHLN